MMKPWASLLISSALLVGCTNAPQAPSEDEAASEAPAPESERRQNGNLITEGVPEIPAEIAERLRQFQNVRSHRFQDWASDGILISTRFGDVSQIHSVQSPKGARRQLTFYEEPVNGADMHPDDNVFAFIKDTGGDEFYQGSVFDRDTGVVTSFTEPGTRNGSLVWSDSGEQIAWYEATADSPNWNILIAEPDIADSRRVAFEGDGAVYPLDWSADAQSLLVQQYISNTKSRLFVVSLADGSSVEINADEDVSYSGAELLEDGDVIAVTDRESEYRNIVRIDGETGEFTSYTDDVNWDVSSWTISPDEETLAFTINENGLGVIQVLDLDTGTISDGPQLPAGIASGLVFHPNGQELGFTFNGATSPSDAWSYNLATGELTRWTNAEIGGLNTDNFVEPENFTYPNADGMDIPAFIYRPSTPGPHPVIVSIHGGPAAQARPGFSSRFQYWASELNLAVIVPNVRGSTGYGKTYMGMDDGLNRKRSVEDIGALLDWVETQDDLQNDKVMVYGGSYGGYMVYASMIDYGERLAGAISIVGISDFATFLTNTKGYRRDLRRVEYGDERDPEIAAFFEEISPLLNADQITKPLFIIQGANDPRVPASESEQILEAVKQNGGDPWYLLALDEGHGFRKKPNQDYQRAAETLFIQDVLGVE